MPGGTCVETPETAGLGFRETEAGLLNSIPRLDTQSKYLTPIPGTVCNMMEPPTGCKFHPRCAHTMDVCKREIPVLREIAPGHHAACHLLGRV